MKVTRDEIEVDGRIVNGSAVFPKAFRAELEKWKDGPIVTTVRRKRAHHSDAQRGYYYGVVVRLIADHTGDTEKEMHEILKAMHLDRDDAVAGRNGKLMNGLVIGGSTSRAKLNTLQMHEYIERCRSWAAAELDVLTPDPDPDYWKERDERARPRAEHEGPPVGDSGL